MADSINNKAKEYYDNDDTGGSLNNNLKDFLKQQGAEGNSLNTLWRNYAYGEGGNSLNTRLGKLWGTSGSLIKRWKDVLGLTWDELKLFFNARRNDPELLLSGATSFDGNDDYINLGQASNLNFDADADDFTISLWFKIASGVEGTIISKGGSTTGNRQYQIFKASNDTIGVFIGGTVVSTSAYSDGNWHHVAVVNFDDSGTQKFKIYVDGSSDGLGTSGSGSNSFDVLLGARRGSDNTDTGSLLDGSIANVGIWNRALNSSEIESIYWKGQYADLKNTELTNLVSWYNLSADANDSTGTNNGTNNGATFLTDAYSASSPFLPRIQDKASDTIANYGEVYGGNAVSFDGTNDYISVSDSSDLSFGDSSNDSEFSISAWINMDDATKFRIASKCAFDGSSLMEYTFTTSGSDALLLQLFDATTGNNIAGFGSTLTSSQGKWIHVACTYDASESASGIKIYVDGSDVTASTSTDGTYVAMHNTTAELELGRLRSGSGTTTYSDGKINNVKIFNTALTQDQVRELYTKPELTLPTGIASSALKLDMPMQEGSGVAILDGSGNQNHGTGDGITWATGQEYGFQHPLVRSNNPMVFDGSNDYISFPFQESGNYTISAWFKLDVAQTSIVVNWGDQATGERRSLLIWNGGSGGYHVYSSTYGSNIAGSTVLSTGVWYHASVTVDVSDGSAKVYLNGSLDGSGTHTINSFTGTTGEIGRQPSGEYFEGIINEVAVWDKILNANEVTALYNSGLPLLPTSDSGNYASADDLAGYWRNDGVTTWTDRSTNSNNGTVSGSPASIIVPEGLNEGRDSQGYYLTDTDSISSGIRLKGAEYISVQDSESLDYTGSFTIGYWVKPSSLTNNDRMITKGTTGTGEWMISIGGGDKIRVYAKDNNDNVKDFTSANALVIGSWSYVTIVINKSNDSVDVYKDGGNLSQGTSAGWDASFSSSVNLRIGVNSSGSGFFNGSIDEVKIYDKALSATEILKNYNNGKSAHSN